MYRFGYRDLVFRILDCVHICPVTRHVCISDTHTGTRVKELHITHRISMLIAWLLFINETLFSRWMLMENLLYMENEQPLKSTMWNVWQTFILRRAVNVACELVFYRVSNGLCGWIFHKLILFDEVTSTN